MAVKLLFLLAFVITQVSCDKNSLTFVIDDTMSMHDEISQVKDATKAIMEIVLKEKASQIKDIVLVTFNDPEIAFKQKTRDEGKLKQALNSIHVHGGGDCWEMALTGIKKGLEESLPGSYVFVFTDASAKDYKKFAEIQTLTQEKQSQIVFIVTGDCNDISQETYQVYHKIAAASNGQVFRIRKHEVGQVLEYVKETIKGDRTVIASTIVPAETWRDVNFNIDEHTEYAIVSASGQKVVLHIFDPKAHDVSGKHVTWTHNVKVIKLTNMARGTYIARVRGNSEVNIMVFGRTDFTFQHGFSTTVQTNMKATDPQPTTGVKTHLMVSVLDVTHSALIKEVELVDMQDKVLMTLPLTNVKGDIYKTDLFLAPEQTFQISVVAKSKTTGSTVKRIAKTPVTPIPSVAPAISKTENVLKVKEGNSIDVHCRTIKGKPKPEISWYMKKEGATNFIPLKGTDEVYHVIKALTNDQYQCVASNVRGRDKHIVTLDVQMAPAISKTENVLKVKEGNSIDVYCRTIKGKPKPEISWYMKKEGATKFTPLKGTDEVYHVTKALTNDQYQCVASNVIGRDEHIVTLDVHMTPAISKTENVLKVKEGNSIDVHCRTIKGKPKPEISWYMKKEGATKFTPLKGTDEVYHVTKALTSDQYQCVASNVIGRDEHIVSLDVQTRPEFQKTPNTIITKEGEPATIECKLQKGNPRPKVTWQVKLKDTAAFTTLSHDGEVWRMPTSHLSKSGTYKCLARNTEGSDEKVTELVVKAKPTIENAKPKHSIMENGTTSLPCRVRGFPKPTVNWFYKGLHSADYKAISKNTEGLLLKNVQLIEAGHYKCVAENEVDKTEHVIELTVNAPPRIMFVPPNTPEYSGVEGDVAMRLTCTVVGYPTPSITWEVDNHIVGSDKSRGLYVENNALLLLNPKKTHSSANSHTYVCHAKNEFGKNAQPFEVYISKYVDSGNANDSNYGAIDRPHHYDCPLPFTDPISVKWYKNTTYYATGPSLHFEHPTEADSGNYTCRMSDLNSAASHTVEVIFGSPPAKTRTSYKVKWKEGKSISCYAGESPRGKYKWFYNGEKLEHENTESLVILSWGQYTCHITHPLGNLVLNFKVTANVCGIPKSFLKTEHAPLILGLDQAWLSLSTSVQNLIVPHSDKLQLICQHEDSSKHATNSFKKFPTLDIISATCDKEYDFLVDGVSQKIAELECKNSVTPSVQKTKKSCLGQNTELMHVGFHVNGFTEVYQSCVDTIRNVPLYTKINTIAKKESIGADKAVKSACVADCCYEKLQLVNAVDVSYGPAEKATFIDRLNSVNYCKPKNSTSWHGIEKMTRGSSEEEQFTVWSGAAKYTKVGEIWTPQYLWKVMKPRSGSEKRVVIHKNSETTGPKLCTGTCGEDVIWFEPVGDRTYCCSLDDFKKAFGVTIDFNES